MSLDLYEQEIGESMRGRTPAPVADVGIWDGFVRGTGLYTMRGLAGVARGVDILGSVGPIVQDAFTGGTEAQDKYFREHDEVWGSAVDFWTPKPREVGAAAEIAGTLISMLPLVLTSPSLAVGSLQLGTAEDLVRKGVEANTANLVGATQGLGLGLGIYMPIFGQTLAQRVLAGGVGFNVLQGVGMRAAGEVLLEGTPGEGEFKTLDPAALTLDVLLGAAFGGLVHLSPAQRAQGAQMWSRLEAWGKGLKQSDLDAMAVLRQAQHLNADSMPGRPADPVDVERHAGRVRQAIEQLARNEPVDVSDLPAPRFEADEPRLADMARRARELAGLAEDVRKSEGLPKPPEEPMAPPARQTESEAPAATRGVAEPPPPRGDRGGEAAGAEGTKAEPPDPVQVAAERFVAEQPDLLLKVGEDTNGQPILQTAKQYLEDATRQADEVAQDVKLFELAATCLLGRG